MSASSGVTWPSERLSHTLFGVRPRERMSSENDVSLAKFFSMRAATKLPEPWRRTSNPSSDQAVDRLAHRDARDRQLGRDLALRRQGVVRCEHPLLDGLTERPLQLLVQRRVATGLDRPDLIGKTRNYPPARR